MCGCIGYLLLLCAVGALLGPWGVVAVIALTVLVAARD